MPTLEKEDLKDYLLAMISPLLSDPESAKCTVSVDDLGTLYELDVAQKDMGRVLGRNGETINAIRTVFRVAGLSHGIRTSVKLLDKQKQ